MTKRAVPTPRALQLGFGLLTLGGLLLTSPAAADDSYDEDRDSDDDSRKRDDTTTDIAVDFNVGAAINTPGTDTGGGGQLRLGREWDLCLVSLTPEIGGSRRARGARAVT